MAGNQGNTTQTTSPNAPNITLLERRIAALEAQIASKAESDVFSGSSAKARAGSTPPRVSGLSVTNQVGTITWTWNGVPIQDLRFYRVEVSDSANMAGAVATDITQTHFTFQDADPAKTYYARVKAVALSGATGPNSNIVSSDPGLAQTANIADEAVGLDQITPGAIYDFNVVTASPAYSVTTSYAEITGCRVSLTVPDATRSAVKILVTFNGTSTLVGAPTSVQNIVSTKIQRGAGASPSTWTDIIQLGDQHMPTSGAGVSVAGDTPDVPGAGVFTYRIVIQYTNKSNASDSLTISDFELVAEVLAS